MLKRDYQFSVRVHDLFWSIVSNDTPCAESTVRSPGSIDDSKLQNEVRDERGVKYADTVLSDTLCALCVAVRTGVAPNSAVVALVGGDGVGLGPTSSYADSSLDREIFPWIKSTYWQNHKSCHKGLEWYQGTTGLTRTEQCNLH